MEIKEMSLGAEYRLKNGEIGVLRHINETNDQCTYEFTKEVYDAENDRTIKSSWVESFHIDEVISLHNPDQISLLG